MWTTLKGAIALSPKLALPLVFCRVCRVRGFSCITLVDLWNTLGSSLIVLLILDIGFSLTETVEPMDPAKRR
jgi:hypothetical protein